MGQKNWGWACALALLVALASWESAKAQYGERMGPEEEKHSAVEAERRIEEQLDRPLKGPLSYVDVPLNQIAAQLQEDFGIPIVFDAPALDSIAQSPEVEVSLSVHDVTLRSALALLLNQAEDLTYVIDNEVLLITSKDEADKKLEVRVYRVEDLQAARRSEPSLLGNSKKSPASLANVVARFVDRDSWAVNGAGEGEIEEWPGLLLVSNTSRVHRGIEQLLEKMRTQKQEIESSSQYRLNGPEDGAANPQVVNGRRGGAS